MNIQTDGYEEEGEYLHGRDTFNYFSDIFHISHGPHEGQKYQDLITNSNTLSKKIFYFLDPTGSLAFTLLVSNQLSNCN